MNDMYDDDAGEIADNVNNVDDVQIQVQSHLMIGEECSKNDDQKGALAAFNKAISLDPSCDMAWFQRTCIFPNPHRMLIGNNCHCR